MDLLFKRYADPYLLLNCYIGAGRLLEFVDEISEIYNEEIEWDYFLHKVFDMTFEEFKNKMPRASVQQVSEEQVETTVQNSMSILNGFTPS